MFPLNNRQLVTLCKLNQDVLGSQNPFESILCRPSSAPSYIFPVNLVSSSDENGQLHLSLALLPARLVLHAGPAPAPDRSGGHGGTAARDGGRPGPAGRPPRAAPAAAPAHGAVRAGRAAPADTAGVPALPVVHIEAPLPRR